MRKRTYLLTYLLTYLHRITCVLCDVYTLINAFMVLLMGNNFQLLAEENRKPPRNPHTTTWDGGTHIVSNGDLRLRASVRAVVPLTMNYDKPVGDKVCSLV